MTSNLQNVYLCKPHFEQFHFRDVGILNLFLHHEYQSFLLMYLKPLQSTLYAILDDLCPMEIPNKSLLVLQTSIKQNLLDLLFLLQAQYVHHLTYHLHFCVKAFRIQQIFLLYNTHLHFLLYMHNPYL